MIDALRLGQVEEDLQAILQLPQKPDLVYFGTMSKTIVKSLAFFSGQHDLRRRLCPFQQPPHDGWGQAIGEKRDKTVS